MSLCKTVVKLLKKLTTCINQNEFLGNKNVILASQSFVGSDSNEKRYVYNLILEKSFTYVKPKSF